MFVCFVLFCFVFCFVLFILQSPHCAANCLQQVARANRVQITCNTSSAYHVQHGVFCATWYEGTAQLLSLTEMKSHRFELYFIGWTIKPMNEGRKPQYLEKTPGDELQKIPHIEDNTYTSRQIGVNRQIDGKCKQTGRKVENVGKQIGKYKV